MLLASQIYESGTERQVVGALGIASPAKAETTVISIARADRAPSITGPWFDLDDRPCFLLARSGRLLDCNAAAERQIKAGVVRMDGDRLSFGDRRVDMTFLVAVEGFSPDRTGGTELVLPGADGVWLRCGLHPAPETDDAIFVSIRAAASVSESVIASVADAAALTAAQARVLRLLAEGSVPKEIGRKLNVSTATVRTHLRTIFRKLDVRGIAGALRLVSQLND
jgi:DNA-binding CsgD family transcriptional regulator